MISIGLGTAGESHKSYWMPNALSTFVSWHVLEYFFYFPMKLKNDYLVCSSR